MMDTSVDPDSSASADKCASSLIRRMDTGQLFILEGDKCMRWENDRAVTDFFQKVSMGDCRAWLQDFLVRWEGMSKTSGK